MRDHPAYLAETLVALFGTGGLDVALNSFTQRQRAAVGALANATHSPTPARRKTRSAPNEGFDLGGDTTQTPEVAVAFVKQLETTRCIRKQHARRALKLLDDMFFRFWEQNPKRTPTANEGAQGQAGGDTRPKTKLVSTPDTALAEQQEQREADHNALVKEELHSGHLERVLQALLNISRLIVMRELAPDASAAMLRTDIEQAIAKCAQRRGVALTKPQPQMAGLVARRGRGRPKAATTRLRDELMKLPLAFPGKTQLALSKLPIAEVMKQVELAIASSTPHDAEERARAAGRRARKPRA